MLSRVDVRLDAGITGVTYAHTCWFRGSFVPHLVVQTVDGPVTIFVLTRENVRERTEFAEGGYSGSLVPAARGALAVLARDPANVDAIVLMATAAIRYVN